MTRNRQKLPLSRISFHVTLMAEEPIGARLYKIRLACGDGVRRAEPLADFVGRVEASTGARYTTTAVSLLERDQQGWRMKDIDAFAAVDPLERGRVWLAFGEIPVAPMERVDEVKKPAAKKRRA